MSIAYTVADMETYERLVRQQQALPNGQRPVLLLVPVNPEPSKKEPPYVNPDQARAKERKELEDVRAWWSDLPEDKKQAIREEQFVPKKKDKKKSDPVEYILVGKKENSAYSPKIATSLTNSASKPDVKNYVGLQQLAAIEM